MDISNFLFVGQWKVSGLTMSTLLQRLGRAARDLLLHAIFALFVESKHFDHERSKISQKRPADTQAALVQHPCSPSQPHNGSSTNTAGPSSSRALITLNRPRTFTELKRERKAAYAEHYRSSQIPTTRRSAKSKPVDELDPAVDDLVNSRFGCCRIPCIISFDNDEVGAFFFI